MTLQEFILEFSPYDNITGYKNIYINSHNMISFEGEYYFIDGRMIEFRITIKKDNSYKVQFVRLSDSAYYHANKHGIRQQIDTIFNWWTSKYKKELQMFF